MSALRWSPGSAAALLLAISVAAVSTASAKQIAKKSPQRSTPSVSINNPTAAPARFFTINQVLAKRDAQRASGSNLQFASTTATMTDASPSGRHSLPSDEPFGLFTFRAPEGLLWIKWRGIEKQLQAEAAQIVRCRADSNACSIDAKRFLTFVEAAQARQGRARIEVVNRAVNSAIRYTTDFAQHGVADQWTAPLATLAAGRGDCEDYAIAKYVLLREAGTPANNLRLLLVRDRAARQDHAVLAVRDNGRWLILDNRNLTLAETTTLPQFAPLFALDHQGVKLFAAPYAARPMPDAEPAGAAPAATEQGDIIASPAAAASTTPYLL